MMGSNRHILNLDFPETSVSTLFPVKDMSTYSTLIPVNCPSLEIVPPGYRTPVAITMIPGFNENLSACDLGISFDCSESLPELPDGIYHIRYSVSPNAKVYVEYNCLRTVRVMANFAKIACSLGQSGCAPTSELHTQIRELQYILWLIQSAKYYVEDCNKPDEGIDMLRYAKKRMEKFTCSTC